MGAAAGLAAGFVFLPLGEWAVDLVDYVRGAGAPGVLIYALVYIVATVLLVPGSLLTIGAGSVWGLWGGVALVLPASLIGAQLAFFAGRYLARDWVGRKVASKPRLAAVDEAIGGSGFQIVFLLRLSPLVPFALLNYFLGITAARARDYFLASAVGMIPGIFLYVYIGSLVTNAAALSTGETPEAGLWGRVLFWGGLVATLVVTIYVSRLARRKLDEKLAAG